MVLKRRGKEKEPQPIAPDLDLVDEMVRKTLEANPEMRGGNSTLEFIAMMRQQAVDRMGCGGGQAPAHCWVSVSAASQSKN